MSDSAAARFKSNPFATRYVAPGQLSWIAPDRHSSLETLRDKFDQQLNRRAAIIGPHGSGKSTLLEHLMPTLGPIAAKLTAHEPQDLSAIEVPSGGIVWLKLRGRKASRQLLLGVLSKYRQPAILLVLDGYEQLSWLMRSYALFVTRRRHQGLLVTSHRSTGLPVLLRTQVTPTLASQVTDRLLPADYPDRAGLIEEANLARLLEKHAGNLREVYMELYDLQ